MAFRGKAKYILPENPDILVLPESEHPDKIRFGAGIKRPYDSFWYGDNLNKGLSVYSYGDFKILPLAIHNRDFRFVVPLLLKNQKTEIILLAVWCQKPDIHDNYGIHMWGAVNFYTEILKLPKILIAGDFNSSSIWDRPNREANHSNIVKLLDESSIRSTYHVFYGQEQGKEKDATLYLNRKINKPYHINYFFASDILLKKLKDVRIGKYEDWIRHSDHMPIIGTFDF